MKQISSRQLIAALRADGWLEVGCTGSHHQFKHPTKPGKVTVPHPKQSLAPKTLADITKKSGILLP